jgi:hypothetical protein
MLTGHDCNTRGHIGKVLKDEYRVTEDRKNMIPVTILWGCTECDATSEEMWSDFGVIQSNPDHIDSELCNCFGCKAKTLQLATGDASGNIIASGTTQKKWDKELNFYKEARAQGVQPEGTSTKAIQKALEASETLNKPYNANKMPKAKDINKASVEVMKEIGQI